MDTPAVVGAVYIVVSGLCILLNCVAIRGIFVQGKLKKHHSAMYILYLQPLITDVIYQLNYMCYHAPSVIIQNYLFPLPQGPIVTLIVDTIQLYCWMSNSLSQISLALNRFTVTVLLRLNFFTRDRAILMSIAQHLFAASFSVVSQFVLPCCRLQFDFTIFAYRELYIADVPNTSWTHLKRPVQIACSCVPFVLYTIILLTIRSIGKRLKLQSSEVNRRRKQELRFTAQFATIASIYTLSWLVFSFLPETVFTSDNKWIYGLSFLLGVLNATTNAIVFLLNDTKKLCSCCIAASPAGSTH